MPEDTICASATPPINSPIAVVRITGPETYRAVKSIFNHTEKIRHRIAVYGSVIHKDELIDDVVLVYYESPNSFTGEDMAEISCHGSPIIVRKIIRILNELDIRIAEPGEFSKRSFLNGKIDLTEAEAINHIITARSDWEVSAAIKQMHGALHNKVNAIRDLIIHLKADIEAGIDFIEENIEFISNEDAIVQLNEIKALLKDLQKRCRIGEKISHGIDIPIVGRPNVGKSSILNLILNKERAIVTDIPGTTRDIINEIVQFAGVPVNLMDTAGITDTNCAIEQKGIELSGKKIETASIVIVVIDAGSGVTDSDLEIIESIKNKKAIILANKIDLVSDRNKAMSVIEKKTGKVIHFSAKTGEGLSLLEQSVAEIFKNEFVDYNNSFIADMRVINILEKAVSIIEEAERLLLLKEPQEILAFLLQSLIDCFSEITGEISPDDVLNSIFGRFCIGK